MDLTIDDAIELETPDRPALLAGVVERAFNSDPDRLGSFLSPLLEALPAETAIHLRGSAVMGESFNSHRPFDAAGPGTSDLDLVITGPNVMALFDQSGFYLPAVNSLPLNDENPWVSPALDRARRQAQQVARRPVCIQAMAEWFLDLREKAQGTPSVLLGQTSE